MPVASGTRFGPYEILAPLGAGGMGEVYKARDTRLDRSVAVKVLPAHLAATPAARSRFEREARAVSSLNHPHICVLHDVGHENGVDYLVMEYLEGETLEARLARGPLPVAELLRIGTEIADALDKAHRQGLVHRDLKPGNIMITRSGAKLLDFGLTRPMGPGAANPALTQTPTVAAPLAGLTAQGSIVGTFQYMAPEQLEGQEADARTDLFALGAVLYEMATGRKAFEGKSHASLIAAILEKEPVPIATAVPLAPPALDRLVRACLAKDPEQRVQTAHDVKLQLQWIAEGGSQAGVPVPVAARRRSREAIAWAVAAAGVLAALGLGGALLLRRPETPRVTRFEVRPPPRLARVAWPRLAPDGRHLAFVGTDSAGTVQVWMRPMDAVQAYPVPGTEGASRPFWSPDGRYLAWFSENKLKKVSIAGGPAVTMAEANRGADGSWGFRDQVLFDGSLTDSIRVVPASGGTPRYVTHLNRARGDIGHAWPSFLPDGQGFLYVSFTSSDGTRGEMRAGRIGSVRVVELGPCEGRVEYAPPGYIVFMREGTLLAQRFDPRALRTSGDPVPIAEDVVVGQGFGSFSVSREGSLVYTSQGSEIPTRLVWVDRAGRRLGEAAPPGHYRDLALSPQGDRLAIAIEDPRSAAADIWIRNLVRGVSTRLTFEGANEIWPVWSPDGAQVAYASNRGGEYRVWRRAVSGSGDEDSLGHLPGGNEGPNDWSRDGRWIVSAQIRASWDVHAHAVEPGQPIRTLLGADYHERRGALSPDGRWLAYVSNESGGNQVYVQSFPTAGGKWQVSTDGGGQVFWRADGRELFYRKANHSIMAVPIQTGETVEIGTPVELFRETVTELGLAGAPRWAPTPDGQRFLLNVPGQGVLQAGFTLVTGWASELKRR